MPSDYKENERPALAAEFRPIESLIPYARNARTHSDEQVAQIAASIVEFGFTNPVLADERGIVAGHGRVMGARKVYASGGVIRLPTGVALPPGTVPVIDCSGWSDAQRKAYVLADNQLALNAGWDLALLKVEIGDLQAEGFDLELLGFGDELEKLLAPDGTEGLTDPDETPEPPAEPVTRAGDVWVLGRHRILCGSCTNIDDVERIMGGQRANLCLTDPPYGLGVGKESGKNDYVEYVDSRENLVQLAKDWLPIAQSISDAVVFSPGVTNQWLYPEPNWVMCWFYGGGQLRSSWGFNCWQPFLCYGKEPGLAAGCGARPDAIDMNTPANSADINHPCPKPVKLWGWFLKRLVFKPSALLFEPFSGSGTTIIAAEAHGEGASVRAIELTAAYVDVAVTRWEKFTGQAATLDGDGRTFAEVLAERLPAGAIEARAE